MANELKHGSVGTELTQAEWEAVGAHVIDSQAEGDIVYASSSSQLSRLGKGADNTVLHLASGVPAWTATPTLTGLTVSGALTLSGDDVLHTVGADADGVLVLRSESLNADTTLAGVIVGTAKTYLTRANTLMISNVADAGGNIHILATDYANNTFSVLWGDGSGSTWINALGGQTLRLTVGTAEEYVFSTTAVDFRSNHLDNAGYLVLNAVTLPAGSEAYLGNDNAGDLTLNALTGKTINLAVNGSDEYGFSATAAAFGANDLTMTGDIAATGARVSHIYTTNQTTTNAETVDSWSKVKDYVEKYAGLALDVVMGMDVVMFTHEADRDPSRRVKLGVDAESIREPLATPMGDYGDGVGIGPRVDMGALAALNTRAIQELADRVIKLEAVEA